MEKVLQTWENFFHAHPKVAKIETSLRFRESAHCVVCGADYTGGYYVCVVPIAHDGERLPMLERCIFKSEKHTKDGYRNAHSSYHSRWDSIISEVWDKYDKKKG